jgi:hypothetical protein
VSWCSRVWQAGGQAGFHETIIASGARKNDNKMPAGSLKVAGALFFP